MASVLCGRIWRLGFSRFVLLAWGVPHSRVVTAVCFNCSLSLTTDSGSGLNLGLYGFSPLCKRLETRILLPGLDMKVCSIVQRAAPAGCFTCSLSLTIASGPRFESGSLWLQSSVGTCGNQDPSSRARHEAFFYCRKGCPDSRMVIELCFTCSLSRPPYGRTYPLGPGILWV